MIIKLRVLWNRVQKLVKTTSEELKSLKDGDIVILWGGSNDIGKNNTNEPLNLLMEFVTKHKELNIVILNSPHRYDLVPTSCVNFFFLLYGTANLQSTPKE